MTTIGNIATITGTNAGNASLIVKATNSCGTTNPVIKSVSISNCLTPTIIGSTFSICKNQPVSFAGIAGAALYTWSFPGGNPQTIVSTSAGAVFVIYTAAGIYGTQLTVASGTNTLTGNTQYISVVNSCCTNSYYVNTGGWANPDPNRLPYEIGVPGTTTVLSGGATFNGSYHLLGNLQMSGNVNFVTGSKLYADEGAVISFTGANISINGALLTSVCPLTSQIALIPSYIIQISNAWGGIQLIRNSSLNMNNNATISGAMTGIAVDGSKNNTYQINQSTFYNNISGLTDLDRNNYTTNPTIQGTNFVGDGAIIYQAIGLSGTPDGLGNVSIEKNIIHGIAGPFAIYSVNGSQVINNNYIYDVLVGVYNGADGDPAKTLISNNTILVRQIIPNYPVWGTLRDINYGIYLEYANSSNIIGNKISLNPNRNFDVGSSIGIFSSWYGNITSNTITGLEFGAQFVDSYETTFAGNYLKGNAIGTGVFRDIPIRDKFLVCNTYDGTGNSSAIGIQSNDIYSYTYSIGTPTAPTGNKFQNNAYDLQNNNLTAVIDYYLGLDELLPTQLGNVSLINIPYYAACSSKGYPAGNGRMESTETKYPLTLSELQDSLRYQVGNASRQKYYQAEIIASYKKANDLTGLETYAATLINCNREAYYAFYLYLMYQYQMKGETARVLGCKNAALAPDSNEPNIKSQILWFEYNQQRPVMIMSNGKLPSLTKIDSTNLAYIANSGTALAKEACNQLQFFYRNYVCNPTYTYRFINTDCNNVLRKEIQQKSAESEYLLQAAPNPTADETKISYSLKVETKKATIVIYHSISLQKVMEIPLDVTIEKGTISVSFNNITSGLYIYSLVVGDETVVSKKLAVMK